MNDPVDHLSSADAAAVEALVAAATTTDGVSPFGEDFLLRLRGGDALHWVIRDADALIGYAQLAPDGSSELAVTPEYRRSGHGRALLDGVLERRPDARVWSHGDLAAARELGRARGMQVIRELLVLGRPLGQDDSTAPTLPDGYRARPFVVGQDEDTLLAINAAAFAHHPEQGRLDRDGLRARMEQAWFDPSGLIFIEDEGGKPVAFHWTKVEDDASGTGEVYVVGVHPDAQGRGLGGPLTALGLAHLAGRGLRDVILYVEGDNTPALATYARAGFTRRAVHVMYALGD